MKDTIDIDVLIKTFDDLPAGVGIFKVCDLEDNKSIEYEFINKVLLYEMRKEKHEVIGKKIIEVAPEAYQHEGGLFVINTYMKIAKEGGSINLGLVEYSNEMVAGTYECSVHHIKDNYIYALLRNVTELEIAKNKLEAKNKELSQFVSVVSHDLKEPLNTIYSFIDLLKEENKDKLDDEAFELLSFISNASIRMRAVIKDLLDYSRLGHKKKRVKVDCNKLLENLIQDLNSRIQETKATIKIGEMPVIDAYETELRLLFQNLLSNSMKFNKPGRIPIIKISAEKENGWTFTIEDNGIGIAEDNKDKIFNVFERLHSSEEYEGTGIGLAHCKKIVEMHNGKIWVDSELGTGSKFYFNIPTTI